MKRLACDGTPADEISVPVAVSAPDVTSIKRELMPQHVAIIMDGNNRWARQQGLSGAEGHRAGGKQLRKIIKAVLRQQIAVLTVFAFSSENWRRPPQEVQALMALFIESLDREVPKLHQQSIGLRFIGDLSAFSEPLQTRMRAAQQLTANNQRLVLVCALNYGGRWDITQAAVRLIESCIDTSSNTTSVNTFSTDTSSTNTTATAHTTVIAPANSALSSSPVACLYADWRARIDEEALHQYTCLSDLPPVDLCIRTGSEKRISNFLLWQLAYAELVFSDQLWPDFNEGCFLAALQEFGRRQRRFGRTSEQVQAMTS
jgi:undecaprenyl diphosphate synthase